MKNNLTVELKRVLKKIQDKLIVTYPGENLSAEYFVYAVLNDEKSTAYQILDKTMFNDNKDTLKNTLKLFLEENSSDEPMKEDDITATMNVYDDIVSGVEKIVNDGRQKINSGHLLLSFASNHKNIKSLFKKFGVTYKIIKDSVSSLTQNEKGEKPKKAGKKFSPRSITDEYVPILKEMNGISAFNIVGNQDIIKTVFVTFSRYDKTNVLLIGESGVGKNSIVKQIANLIFEENVPEVLKNKVVLNFRANLIPIANHFEEIFNDAQARGRYIFYIEDIDSLIYDGSVYVDMIRRLLMSNTIRVIATATEEKYNRSEGERLFGKWLRKIHVNEKTEDECVDIIKSNQLRYETYYDISYPEDMIRECVTMVKRYVPNAVLPQTAIDVFDEIGATAYLRKRKNSTLKELETELEMVEGLKTQMADEHNEDKYMEYSKLELELKTKIAAAQKEMSLKKNRPPVSRNDMFSVITSLSQLPISEVTTTERDKLIHMEEKMREKVIGQDKAVTEVVKTVKRQRIGLGKPGKPSVMMFVGNSGTGKTHLARTLANELFGDEKSFVKIDMSEYNDKTSVNKIYGSSAGYVGYDNGGIITEAVKKHKHCVLLLDEMEKATDEVHDVFLQMFDEGHLTDNKGVTVDFGNCIIIMTSNIGAKEAALRGSGVGFVANDRMTEDIIKAEMKKRFKPEFINRIDNIVMFNKLTDDDIKKIIEIEVKDLRQRVVSIGYGFDDEFIGKAVNHIFEMNQKQNENEDFGARPVVRLVRSEIEDKITEFILVNEPEKGHKFTFDELQ